MITDFRDLLRCLVDNDVRFLVVGAHALAAHGIPRATGDLDVWVEATELARTTVIRAVRLAGLAGLSATNG